MCWCVSVRASLQMCREEWPTTCHWMVYWAYNMLNMFRALQCPSSGTPDYMCFITAYGVLESSNIPHSGRLAGCPAPDLRQPANKASQTIGGNNTHIISSSWWWAQKCPKHVEYIISAINHLVASSWFFFSTHRPEGCCVCNKTFSIRIILRT
jgi:hypothetical protein